MNQICRDQDYWYVLHVIVHDAITHAYSTMKHF